MSPKAHVTRDIADLLPQFLRNRQTDIDSLRAGLATQDEARLLELGQRMYALGNPYGFPQITTLGRHVMESSAKRDFDSVRSLVAQYRDYLEAVEVVYIDRPPMPWEKDAAEAAPVPAPAQPAQEQQQARAA
jgi:hypothetical protein